jgi:hypothetical protein
MTKLQTLLRKLNACVEAIGWVGDRDLPAAWQECERADWILWLCGRMQGTDGWPTKKEIVLAACDCAESVLAIFEKKYPQDDRPRRAIATARAWAEGKASREEMRSAAYAADAADAADAARSSARNKKLKDLADLVRKRLKVPMLESEG